MDWKLLLFSHRGRIGRKSYWLGVAAITGVSLVVTLIDSLLFGSAADGRGPLSLAATAALMVPQVAINTKRLHDLDRSGWWQVLAMGALGGAVALAMTLDQNNPNANLGAAFGMIALLVLSLAMGVWIMAFAGTPASNRFGAPESGSRRDEPLSQVFG